MREMSNFIGPVLPPHLLNRVSPSEDSDCEENNEQTPSDIQKATDIETSVPPYLVPAASEGNTSDSDSRPPPDLEKQITEAKTPKSIGPQLLPREEQNVNETGSNLQSQRTIINTKITNKSTIGPTLPIKLRTKLSSKLSKISEYSDEEPGMIGPVLPPHLKNPSSDGEDSQDTSANVIGPRLSPFLTSRSDIKPQFAASGVESNEMSIIGPSLPSYLKSKLEDELPTVVEDESMDVYFKTVLGPSLPSHLKLNDDFNHESSEEMYGPALPLRLHSKTVVRTENEKKVSESDDEDMGPLPEGSLSGSRVQHQLELRARQLRKAMTSEETSANEGPTQRESWMLELPADRAPELGLRPRQFRVREAPEPGDRSVWTDTPADRENKKKTLKLRSLEQGSLERQAMQERDETMQLLAEQHGSKRGSRSLMELHEEKLLAKRKKAEEAGEVQERRPFSREVDLHVNHFDEVQKRSILKKAQHLNDRFSSGHSKFL